MSTLGEHSALALHTLKTLRAGCISIFKDQILLGWGGGGSVKPVSMEVKTVLGLAIGSEFQPTQFYLKSFSVEPLPLLGELQVAAKFQTQEMQPPLVVVQCEKPVLLGWS